MSALAHLIDADNFPTALLALIVALLAYHLWAGHRG